MVPDYGGIGPWPVPDELTPEDLDAVVDGFVAAAVAAQTAGFDGVEVHAANGYLLDQFLRDPVADSRRACLVSEPINVT